jgi:hypothetical protein
LTVEWRRDWASVLSCRRKPVRQRGIRPSLSLSGAETSLGCWWNTAEGVQDDAAEEPEEEHGQREFAAERSA